MAGIFAIDYSEVDRLQKAIQEYQGNTEDAINDVLHNYAGNRAQEDIYRLMPVSKKKKGSHAAHSKSLKNIEGNLSVTVTTTKKYQYLYFPDDGTNTERHIGYKGKPREFFRKGGEAAQDDIIERCVARLINDFE
jgi:hypothetical protein